MKLALISLSKDDPDGGGAIGLLPLFDTMVVDRQVRIAVRMGAQKIVFLCPTMPGSILQYIDQLKRDDIDAEIVRTARELVQYASDDDQLLIFGDGILPSSSIEEHLTEQQNELLYVVANADVFEDFERIDLNQRWVGLAQLKASRLSMMIDVPDDWNVGSALLRIAVQSECPRELIADPDMVAGAVVHLEDSSETAEYTRRQLKEPGLVKGGLLERYMIWPIARRILPKLWQFSSARTYLRAGALLAVLFASVSAYFQLSILSLCLVLIAALIASVARNMDVFSEVSYRLFSDIPQKANLLEIGTNILTKATLGILVFYASEAAALVPNFLILGLLWVVEIAIQMLPNSPGLRMINPGRLMPILILVMAASVGNFIVGIYVVALWNTVYLGLTSILVSRDIKNPAVLAG